jgi:regulator of sigma E protease
MTLLAINWSSFFVPAGQLLLALTILVTLHEFGHYITARWFKCRVEKFYLFFDFLFPFEKVLNFSLIKKKIGDTVWGLGWFPFGGYVKISGMIDESMDKEYLKQPPQPWEYRSKPAWQRLIIILGGVIVNLILGYLIFTFVLYKWGEEKLPNANMTSGVYCSDSLAFKLGFKHGDRIRQVNGENIAYFEDIMPKMLYAKTVLLEREGKEMTLNMPQDLVGQLVDSKNKILFTPRTPTIVAEIAKKTEAERIGLLAGDKIVAINGHPIPHFDLFQDSMKASIGKTVAFTIERPVALGSKETKAMELSANIGKEGQLGFLRVGALKDLKRLGLINTEVRKYSFGQSFGAAWTLAIDRLQFYINQFKLIFNPKTGAYKGLGGFGSMAKAFGKTWDWQYFWTLTGFLSLVLAFMNVLPIPVLDGGHALFIIYEMLTGRKPSDKFMEYAQMVGMVLIFGLLIFANGNDIWRWLAGK